jgi:hypothetical protein
MLRRLKEDVDKTIPLKEETIVSVELSRTQKLYYKAILTRNREYLARGAETPANVPSLLNVMMELRKCCNHPFLIDGAETAIFDDALREFGGGVSSDGERLLRERCLIRSSSKMVLLDKLLKRLREAGHKVSACRNFFVFAAAGDLRPPRRGFLKKKKCYSLTSPSPSLPYFRSSYSARWSGCSTSWKTTSSMRVTPSNVSTVASGGRTGKLPSIASRFKKVFFLCAVAAAIALNIQESQFPYCA